MKFQKDETVYAICYIGGNKKFGILKGTITGKLFKKNQVLVYEVSIIDSKIPYFILVDEPDIFYSREEAKIDLGQ